MAIQQPKCLGQTAITDISTKCQSNRSLLTINLCCSLYFTTVNKSTYILRVRLNISRLQLKYQQICFQHLQNYSMKERESVRDVDEMKRRHIETQSATQQSTVDGGGSGLGLGVYRGGCMPITICRYSRAHHPQFLHPNLIIDQATDQWRYHLNECVNTKGKHFEHLMCSYVIVNLSQLSSLHHFVD